MGGRWTRGRAGYILDLFPRFLGVAFTIVFPLFFPFLSWFVCFVFFRVFFYPIFVIGASPTGRVCLPGGHLLAALGRHLLFAFSGTVFVASLEGSWFPVHIQRLQLPPNLDSETAPP